MEIENVKILVHDDDYRFLGGVRLFLENHGFQVLTADEGRIAERKTSFEIPKIVLLDLNLPDVNGREVFEKIKKIDENIPIIIITDHSEKQIADDLLKVGAIDFISKPFKNEVLLDSIKNAIRIKEIQTEEKRSCTYSSLEKFFPFLAHEIRDPLHAIAGALAVMQRRVDLNDKILFNSMRVIQEEINQLNEFVQSCIDFVRPPNKNHFVEFQINEIFPVLINMMANIFEELFPKIKITLRLESQLPLIYINCGEIKKAFLNIIKNSFESMPRGGELIIQTGFKSNSSPEWIEIIFMDNGLGIRKEDIPHLFQPFFTTKQKGTGLGLPICWRIIAERHHGKIHIESEEKKETKIIVELPVRPEISSSREDPS